MTAPDGTAWTVSRRREPSDDAPDEEREEQKRFWNRPAGWAISAVAAAAFIALSLLEPLLGLGIATVLAVAELVDQARRRKPWLVEATASDPQRGIAWRVAGRRRSGQVVDEVAGALERGQLDVDPLGATRLQGAAASVVPKGPPRATTHVRR